MAKGKPPFPFGKGGKGKPPFPPKKGGMKRKDC